MRSSITIRIGAKHDSVTVDGTTFDRSQMSKPEQRKLSRMITAAKKTEYDS